MLPLTKIETEKGIALIQVLIISIVLAILGIYISQTVQSQVSTAAVIKSSHEQVLAIESAQAELLHLMLTENLAKNSNLESVTKRWNFFGKPYLFNEEIAVAVQDTSSLLSLNFTNKTLARNLLFRLGKPDEQIRVFLDSLADWKDNDDLKHLNGAESQYYMSTLGYGPRNSYLQSMSEVMHIKQGNILSLEEWERYFSLSYTSIFNPLNAPEQILGAFVNDDEVVNEVLQLRQNEQLNGLRFYQLTGIDEDDFISFRTGRIFRVRISSTKQGSQINKEFILELNKNSSKRAVSMSNVVWNL